MKLLVVGQAPSRVMPPGARPFEGTTCLTRLAGYAGVSPRERLYDLCDVDNVIRSYPGPAGMTKEDRKYDAFPPELGLEGAKEVWHDVKYGDWTHVVTLGRKGGDSMAQAIGCGELLSAPWFQWVEVVLNQPQAPGGVTSIQVARSPHPGGTSMWWNDPANQEAGQRFWTALFRYCEVSIV